MTGGPVSVDTIEVPVGTEPEASKVVNRNHWPSALRQLIGELAV